MRINLIRNLKRLQNKFKNVELSKKSFVPFDRVNNFLKINQKLIDVFTLIEHPFLSGTWDTGTNKRCLIDVKKIKKPYSGFVEVWFWGKSFQTSQYLDCLNAYKRENLILILMILRRTGVVQWVNWFWKYM